MRKIILMMAGFAIAISAAGYVYGLILQQNDPLKRISAVEVQQALAASEVPSAAAEPVKSKAEAKKSETSRSSMPAPPLPDRVLGNPKATVTIIEYASLTCPHCAHFHKEILPEIKKNYIDTGLVKMIFRPYPFDGIALKGSIMAYCLPETQFYPFLDAVFSSQDQWVRTADPETELKKIARMAGLTDDKYKECSGEKSALNKGILESRMQGQKLFGVESTPTFLIGAEKIEGAKPFTEFKTVLDDQLKTGKKAK